MKLLTTDTDLKFIHFRLLGEAAEYPQDGVVTVDGDWFLIGELEQDPHGGWRVPLEPTERPIGAGPLHILVVTGNDQD